jgi:hypothetical protein
MDHVRRIAKKSCSFRIRKEQHLFYDHFQNKWKSPLLFVYCLTGKVYVTDKSFEDQSEPFLTDNLRRGIFVPNADFGIYLLNFWII